MTEMRHAPVMLRECVDMLQVAAGQRYIDATLGGGGHSEAILQAGGQVLGIDRDPFALEYAGARLAGFGEQFRVVHGNFHDVLALAQEQDWTDCAGILADLGVSSFQLDEKARGFSYQEEAPLDMRMDTTQVLTAWDVVNTYETNRLAAVIREYGEERWAARIAAFITAARPVQTTTELVQLILNAVPAAARRHEPVHPARRTFQALRIEVNDELAPLTQALDHMVSLLHPGGRLAVLTFHSLEDRVVKRCMQRWMNPCTCPSKAPVCVCGKKPVADMVTRKPVTAGEAELSENPRARSAKLRVAQRL